MIICEREQGELHCTKKQKINTPNLDIIRENAEKAVAVLSRKQVTQI